MSLTEFGKAVRKARIECDQTLANMASALGVTPAFLSSVETGRKKIPTELIEKTEIFFKAQKNITLPNLYTLADISNKSVSLEGLDPKHQMLVASLANSSLDDDSLDRLIQEFCERFSLKLRANEAYNRKL